jgi:hypothetical protein
MSETSGSALATRVSFIGLPANSILSTPYYAVDCPFCLEHPEQWRREIDNVPRDERERLAFNRIHGWSTLPSNNFTQEGATQHGRGIGHGIGLCQLGAAALAARSHTADLILAHFYPNTTIRQLNEQGTTPKKGILNSDNDYFSFSWKRSQAGKMSMLHSSVAD